MKLVTVYRYCTQKILKTPPKKKLLEFINEFNKLEGHKINIQKPVALLYTNSKLSETEIKNTVPLTITSKRTEYLRIYLTKQVKELYIDERRQHSWKDIPYSCIGRINIFKMVILPKAIYRFNAISMPFS